jgi:glutamyl-tRNA synthetase
VRASTESGASTESRSTSESSGSSGYRGRFAPSPTGSLHLGNARTALVAWVRARLAGGAFVIRVEDLDGPRTRAQAVTGNLEELQWLGLDWDEGPDVGGPHGPYLQSERGGLYAAALAGLVATGAVFDCYLSRKDVSSASSAPHGPPAAGHVYGPDQRRLNLRVGTERHAAGRTPSQRLAVGTGTVEFHDAFAGPQSFDAVSEVGDIVLRRSDGLWAYQLAVCVDDAAMGITEVVRGADLLTSTAAQLLVYRALGLAAPSFAHVGSLLDVDGARLSKRAGDHSLFELAQSGVPAERVVGMLAASLGWVASPRTLSARRLLAEVDPHVLGSASAEPTSLTPADLDFLARG